MVGSNISQLSHEINIIKIKNDFLQNKIITQKNKMYRKLLNHKFL